MSGWDLHNERAASTRLARARRRNLEAKLYLAVIIVCCLGLLYLASVRDQTVIDHSRSSAIECVAERFAAGATHEMAVELCGGLDPGGLERDLP